MCQDFLQFIINSDETAITNNRQPVEINNYLQHGIFFA